MTISAFPIVDSHNGVLVSIDAGMALRDYFAAKAMQGLLSQSEGSAFESDKIVGAQWAYQMADEMLKARMAT